jgi:hypothetical protein
VPPPRASAGSFRPAKEREHSLLYPHAPHSPPLGQKRRGGALCGKESKKTPTQLSITPANTRKTNRFVLGWGAMRRSYSPIVAWSPEGSEPWSRRRAGSSCAFTQRSLSHATNAVYSCLRGVYMLHSTKPPELLRTPLRRSSRWRESLYSPTPIGPGAPEEGCPYRRVLCA